MEHYFGDGRIIQLRYPATGKHDVLNITTEIARMKDDGETSSKWKMKDNNWYDVTLDELKTAIKSARQQGRAIYDALAEAESG